MPGPSGLRIVIAGGTGQVGTILARHFHETGNHVTVVSRNPKPAEWETADWNGQDPGPWTKLIDGSDVVINLAGKSVNCRYNAANQRGIKLSRTFTTGLVGQAIAAAARPPWLWLNASTATIYRHSLDQNMDDVSGELGGTELGAPAKWRFSIDVATAWERALFAAPVPKTRKVAMRSAMTMSPDSGGVFDALLRLVRFGLGGTVSSGRQYVSWIHDADFSRAVEFLIMNDQMEGAINLASPCPLPNREFMSNLRRAWCTSYIGIPASRWMLEIGALLMRTETELILKSRRVVPRKLTEAGFEFHFPNWRGACADLVARWREVQAEA